METAFFKDLLIILCGYSGLACSYLGWGWAFTRVFNIVFESKKRTFTLIWTGWAIILLLLQLVNIFVPINIFVSAPFLILGAIFAFNFARLEVRLKDISKLPKIPLMLTAFVGIWIATLSMFSPANGDGGLYHFNSIRWLNEHPVVLGLGNLHSRLAFNQSFFAFAAYLNLYPIFQHGFGLANSFLLLLLLSECIFSISGYINREEAIGQTPVRAVATFFIPFLIYHALFTEYSLYFPKYSEISSPTPDSASAILQILIFVRFVRELEEGVSSKNNDSHIQFIFILAATAITVKLSNILFVLSICLILLGIRLKASPLKQAVSTAVKLVAVPSLILLIWSFRGLLLSGCPLYPLTLGCIHVSWAEPLNLVKLEADRAYSWARQPEAAPDQVLSSWTWLGPWASKILENKVTKAIVIYPLVVSTLGLFIGLIIYLHKLPSHQTENRFFLIPLPALVGLLFWFYTAPAVRFAQALFWILPISIAIAICAFLKINGKLGGATVNVIIFFVVNASVGWVFLQQHRIFTRLPTAGYQPIPVAKLVQNTTSSGLKVWSPIGDDKCWDSEIPCTPTFDPRLRFTDRRIFPEFTLNDPRQ